VECDSFTNAIEMRLPVCHIAPKKGHPFSTLNQKRYKPERVIDEPVQVSYDIITNTFFLRDGANRTTQAIANGDSTIIAQVEIVSSELGYKSILENDEAIADFYYRVLSERK